MMKNSYYQKIERSGKGLPQRGYVRQPQGCSVVATLGRYCRLARTITSSDWVKEIKRVSSVWIKQREPLLTAFAWQGGYGAFSVSASAIDKIREYIAGQQEHHKKQTFQEEYRAFLRKHGVEWDERFVW